MEPYRPNCYKIPELNGLRVLLVFIVSWYHFWQQSWLTPSIGSYSLDYLLRAGYMPVDGTILLSGFLLFLPYARAMLLREAVPNTKQFYQRRIMRIVPSYYFVTLALLFAVALPWHLYYNSSDMVRDVVMHLTFTQTFNPATYIATPDRGGFLDHCNRDAGVFDLPAAGAVGDEKSPWHPDDNGSGDVRLPRMVRLAAG